MSSQGQESADHRTNFSQWHTREVLENNNSEEFVKEILGETENKEKAKRNALVMLTSGAVNQRIKNTGKEQGLDLTILDDRATAVLGHAQKTLGKDVYGDLPGGDQGIYDIDKYIFSERDEADCFERVWEDAYSIDKTDFTKSFNSENIDHEKYTATVTSVNGEDIECDLVTPEINEFKDTEEVQVLNDIKLEVPSIEEVIRTKSTIEWDNGYGYDAFREKDGEEYLALLHIAEERGIKPDELREGWSIDEIETASKRLKDIGPGYFTENKDDFNENYLPSEDYYKQIVNWQNIV